MAPQVTMLAQLILKQTYHALLVLSLLGPPIYYKLDPFTSKYLALFLRACLSSLVQPFG